MGRIKHIVPSVIQDVPHSPSCLYALDKTIKQPWMVDHQNPVSTRFFDDRWHQYVNFQCDSLMCLGTLSVLKSRITKGLPFGKVDKRNA